MTIHTNFYQINRELTFQDTSQSYITVYALTLSIYTYKDTLIDLRLTFQVQPQLYQHILTQRLFNLQSELCGSLTNGNFDDNTSIEITAIFKSDLLSQLTSDLQTLPDNLLTLNQTGNNHFLFHNNNWLVVQVKQERSEIYTGYRTFWHYLNTFENFDTIALNQSIYNFFQDWAEANFRSMDHQSRTQTISEVTQGLEEWIDIHESTINIEQLKQAISTIVHTFKKLSDISVEKIKTHQNIFENLVNFFTVDEWPYTKIPGESILQTAFSGKNGAWNCYALVRVQQQQFVFYSVYPNLVPENQRLAIAEFITRANSGMIIGNFELDFERGEIRYKTSIDVAEDILTFSAIKNLVYTNVTMMDRYFPGFISIIEDNISPANIIEAIEIMTDELPEGSTVDNSSVNTGLSSTSSSQNCVNISSKKTEEQSYVLTKLTPEQIAQFHQALQIFAPYQNQQSEAIIKKLKKGIVGKLGNIGEEIYAQAYTFFTQVPISAKHLKLIQSYSEIAQQNRKLWYRFKNWTKQHGEPARNSQAGTALIELEKQFWRVDARLCQLPTDSLQGTREMEFLMEIEELRKQLSLYENLMIEIENNPESGFSTEY